MDLSHSPCSPSPSPYYLSEKWNLSQKFPEVYNDLIGNDYITQPIKGDWGGVFLAFQSWQVRKEKSGFVLVLN